MLLSIIIPMYNVENYIGDCLKSMLSLKDRKDIEVLCINDGSPDRSREIALEFEVLFPNYIKVMDKDNGGLSDARNFGLSHSRGANILFVDSDDWVDSEVIEEMLLLIETDNVDIVVADYLEVFPDSTALKRDTNIGNSIVYEATICNKIIKKELFLSDSPVFPLGLWFEDNQTTYLTLARASKIVKLDKVMYFYRQKREGQITSKLNNRIYDINIVANNIAKELDNFSTVDPFLKQDFELIFIRNVLLRTLPKIVKLEIRNPLKTRKKYFQQFDVLEKYFPNWLDNQKFIEDKSGYFKLKIGSKHRSKMKRFRSSFIYFLLSVTIHKLSPKEIV